MFPYNEQFPIYILLPLNGTN